MSRSVRIAGLIILAGSAWSAKLSAQGRLTDLVLTGGMAAELYRGGIPSVTLAVVDSVSEASAASGEFGVQGSLISNRNDGSDGFNVRFDGGVRQFDAYGFKLRDYAPRVWAGKLEAALWRTTGLGVFRLNGLAQGRKVVDRTPIPLFLQPGYANYEGSLLLSRELGGASWNVRVRGGRSDYHVQDIVPQLDLLDRNELGGELSALLARRWNGGRLGFFGSVVEYRYPKQGTSYAPDPFRRDQSYTAGAQWVYGGRDSPSEGDSMRGEGDSMPAPAYRSWFGAARIRVVIQGTMNRSNASRTEYNAVSLRLILSTSLPADMGLDVDAALTAKSYLTETEFARLIPGEEADNASRVYVEISRFFGAVNAGVRLGWTRAETDIGDAYFERYSTSILLRYRP